MDSSTPGFPVLPCLLDFAQTHAHWVGDAIQRSHPLSSPSPPALNLPQHQGLFKWVSSSHQVVKVLELQLQHQSFQWIFRVDFLKDWLVWSPCCPRDSQESSPAPQFKSINSSVLSLLYIYYMCILSTYLSQCRWNLNITHLINQHTRNKCMKITTWIWSMSKYHESTIFLLDFQKREKLHKASCGLDLKRALRFHRWEVRCWECLAKMNDKILKSSGCAWENRTGLVWLRQSMSLFI